MVDKDLTDRQKEMKDIDYRIKLNKLELDQLKIRRLSLEEQTTTLRTKRAQYEENGQGLRKRVKTLEEQTAVVQSYSLNEC